VTPFYTCIWEVFGSSLGLDNAYIHWGVSRVSSFPRGKFRDSSLNRPRPPPPISFSTLSYILLLKSIREGESVNRPQMDTKCKIYDVHTWKKTFISRHILHQHWYACPSLYQCVETCSMEVYWLFSQTLRHSRFNLFVISETFATFLDPVVNRFTWWTLPTINKKHFFMNVLCIESFCSQKTHKRNLLFGSTFKYGRHFDY
jgi:hypothetical protein